MTKIRVHVLNFHHICSHIELLLENISETPTTAYPINRWERPLERWFPIAGVGRNESMSRCTFEIDADPQAIIESWKKYWKDTESRSSIFGENCAVATQWFLTEFARIPKPSLSNMSLNHVALGTHWPSFVPFPILLPGRVMSNAKFYIALKDNPEKFLTYSRLYLLLQSVLAGLLLMGSMQGLCFALGTLEGIFPKSIVGSMAMVVGVVGMCGFFKAYNNLSAKNILGDREPERLKLE